ncbi:Hypothetical predicted protein [Pelobates cultripes]|uniref:Uncharacterized protein n=1 Tax=Pelobates cultripes TaxID=61616 RepID=A0AAD1S2P2_PELCU|nr:Hypothetical predicted protein [Pelobates cultripes]
MVDSSPDSAGHGSSTADDLTLTKRDLQALLLDATTDIKAHTAVELDRPLQALKSDIEALSRRTDQTEARLTTLADTSRSHSQDITYLHRKIASLEEDLEDLNNRSRRNNIRVRGLPESVSVPPDRLQTTLVDLFRSLLPEAHRALRAPVFSPATPRDVIVRLHRFPVKELLLWKARQNPPLYQGKKVAFFQDLAPLTLKKRRDLRQLTLTLTHYGIRYMWGHPFKLVIRKENQTHILSTASEMAPFAASLGLELLPPPSQAASRPRGRPGGATTGADRSPRRTPRKRASEMERSPRRPPQMRQS